MKRIHFFWFLLTLLILNSCSIEKRRYTSGFHVEWHHDRKISQQQFTERKNDSLHHISARPITAIEDERKETKEVLKSSQQNAPASKKKKTAFETQQTYIAKTTSKYNSPNDGITPLKNTSGETPPANKELHKGAFMSLLLSILSWLPLLTFIGTLILQIHLIDSTYFLLLFGGVPFALLAILIAWLSINHIDKYPDRYRNKNMASNGAGIAVTMLHAVIIAFFAALALSLPF